MIWSKVNIHASYIKLPELTNKLSHGYISPLNYITFINIL
jgi:hypothetical protein